MARCVYIHPGVSFKSVLEITGNVGDTITITGPSLNESYTVPNSGKVTTTLKKKGTYSLSANATKKTATIEVSERNHTYTADLSFHFTATITANPGVTVTLTKSSGVGNVVSKVADSTTGIAIFNIVVPGTYTISSTAETANTELSTTSTKAAVGSTSTIVCETNGGSGSADYVRVRTHNIYAMIYSSAVATIYWCGHDAGGNRDANYNTSIYYSGTLIRCAANDYPTSVSAGTAVGEGIGVDLYPNNTTYVVGYNTPSLSVGTTYGFSSWCYTTINGTKYYGQRAITSWTAANASGGTFTPGSGTWTVPAGVRTLTVFLVGGGGGGGVGSGYWTSGSGGCGGGGGYCGSGVVSVTPGEVATVTVGGGGAAVDSSRGSRGPKTGGGGGNSQFYLDANRNLLVGGGGAGEGYGNGAHGGSGGSGGGASFIGYTWEDMNYNGGPTAGGSNGGNANNVTVTGQGNTRTCYGGTGQGASAVTFNGTVYAGGGGGGPSAAGGTRGGGAGGGAGTSSSNVGGSGTAGSGGGGGGSGYLGNSADSWTYMASGWGGSGAVVVIAA